MLKRPKKNAPIHAQTSDYLLFGINIILGMTYSFATNVGMRSITNPNGMAPMVFSGILCTGALLGSMVYALLSSNRSIIFNALAHTPTRTMRMAFFAACCHYGGNVTNMLAAPSVSMSIAWPITSISNLWSYLWGLIYGEYKGAPRIAHLLLACGTALFIVGIFLMSSLLY